MDSTSSATSLRPIYSFLAAAPSNCRVFVNVPYQLSRRSDKQPSVTSLASVLSYNSASTALGTFNKLPRHLAHSNLAHLIKKENKQPSATSSRTRSTVGPQNWAEGEPAPQEPH